MFYNIDTKSRLDTWFGALGKYEFAKLGLFRLAAFDTVRFMQR